MGQGMDVCLGDPRAAATLEDCLEAEFVACLVRQAGLVVLGVKPAAVFSFTPRIRTTSFEPPRLRSLSARLVSVYARLAEPLGLSLACLERRATGLMLLAWRPSRVAALLADAEARALLAERALPADGADALMSELVCRLRAFYARRGPFPHELGLVLGYPVRDVRGFLADGGRGAVACGRWKVYGDAAQARQRFDELDRLEARCKRLYSEGASMGELLRMGAA